MPNEVPANSPMADIATAEQLSDALRGSSVTGEGRIQLLAFWRKQQRSIQQPAIVVDCVGDALPDEATDIFAPGLAELPLNVLPQAKTPEQQQRLATSLLLLADYQSVSLKASPQLLILQQLLADHWIASEPCKSLGVIVNDLMNDANLMIGALSVSAMLADEQREQMAMRLNALLIDGSIDRWGKGPLLQDALGDSKRTKYLSLNLLPQNEQNWLLRSLADELISYDEAVLFNLISAHQLEIVRHPSLTGTIGVLSSDSAENVLHSTVSSDEQATIELQTADGRIRYPASVINPAKVESLEALQNQAQEPTDSNQWVELAYFPVVDNGEATDLHYRPGLLLEAEFTYLLPRLGKKHTETAVLFAMLTPSGLQVDEQSTVACSSGWPQDLQRLPAPELEALATPTLVTNHAKLARSQKRVLSAFASQQNIPIYHCTELGISSEPGETSEDFESRLRQLAAARNEDRRTAIRAKFEPKLRHLNTRLRKADGQYRKALKKLEGGNVLLRPAKYLTSKALSSQLNPGMHLPLRRASSKNKLQSELTQYEQRLERLKRQQRELKNQYQSALDKQQRQYKNQELEYRRFSMKTKAASAELKRCLLCACPWGNKQEPDGDQLPYPVYSL